MPTMGRAAARTSVLRSKTSAQGGIHFRRASEIAKGAPGGHRPPGNRHDRGRGCCYR